MVEEITKTIAQKWLKQALHDLAMAEKNVEISGYDVAAFLAHQSVEKLLKAVFILRGKKVPKTHYIDELAKELKLENTIINSLADLTVDYMFSRYPDVSENVPYEEYDKETAIEKVQIAKKLFELLKKEYKPIMEE